MNPPNRILETVFAELLDHLTGELFADSFSMLFRVEHDVDAGNMSRSEFMIDALVIGKANDFVIHSRYKIFFGCS